jgi:hypothetical protein
MPTTPSRPGNNFSVKVVVLTAVVTTGVSAPATIGIQRFFDWGEHYVRTPTSPRIYTDKLRTNTPTKQDVILHIMPPGADSTFTWGHDSYILQWTDRRPDSILGHGNLLCYSSSDKVTRGTFSLDDPSRENGKDFTFSLLDGRGETVRLREND